MKCPKCGSNQDHVVDTRPCGEDSVKRRRECYTCRHRWNTIEVEITGAYMYLFTDDTQFILGKKGEKEWQQKEKI